jgi:NhaP-type Na+/H+ or K+/H+ antiporter
MRRKKFFKNIGTIMKFGFLGTIVCFALYTAMLYFALQAEWITKENADGIQMPLEMGMFEVLSVTALLCSSDVIAAISMINYSEQPKLFSIVYGEGVFNDIVSIILFNTVQSFKTDFNFTGSTPFTIMGSFFALAAASIGIGLFFGIFSSLMFKWLRFLTHSAVCETILLIIIAFVAYFFSEASELSGIISLLTGGITMAHYTWYNLSP